MFLIKLFFKIIFLLNVTHRLLFSSFFFFNRFQWNKYQSKEMILYQTKKMHSKREREREREIERESGEKNNESLQLQLQYWTYKML